MNTAVRIEEQAARFLLRREAAGWNAEAQAELESWLKASTLHEVTYLRLEHGWRKVDRLSALRTPGLAAAAAAAAPQPKVALIKQRRTWGWVSALAASAASFFLCLQLGVFTRDNYSTKVGEHATVPLTDGSHIEMNTDTRLRTDFDDTARTVWLDRGEAYFDVAHDAARPFVVRLGNRQITVLGTKFSVRRDANRILVAVSEGRVRFEATEASPASAPIVATRGDRVIVNGASALLESNSEPKVTQALSWRRGVLIFDQTSLAEAAQEFNRYSSKKLVVAASSADIRIGGSFEADNLDAFIRLLQNSFGLRVMEDGDEIKVSN